MKFKDAIEEVRNRVNIVDIISQYVRLKRTGNNYMGICPFHNEKTPSFSVSESKQIFKCFGCGKAGNVYTFLQEQEGMTFPEAVKFLASKVNVTIEDEFKTNNQDFKKKELLYKLYKDVANTYYSILYSDIGKVGLEYFIKRKLTKETIKKFGLGFAPIDYGYVYKLMKEKGYEDSILIDSKLFGIKDDKPYDFFYDRVMFPLVDVQNNVVSFQGRILGDGNQKYINTSESLIYRKSKHLFGINYAKLTKSDYYILCEGNMDVITLHQAGIDNAVASWGTAFTVDQANLIKRKVRKVILSQDTDSAGQKAIASSYDICDAVGIETYVLDLSPVKDADEFIIKYGREELNKRLSNPMPTFMYLISKLREQYDLNNSYEYEKYINTIVLKLAKFDNSLIREKYIKDVSMQEKLPLAELNKQVDKYLQGNKVKSTNVVMNRNDDNNDNKESLSDKVERTFANLILNNDISKEKIKGIVSVSELDDFASKYIYEKTLEGCDTNKIIDSLVELNDEEAKKVKSVIFDNQQNFNINTTNEFYKILNELIKKIKINYLNKNSSDKLEDKINKNKKIDEIKRTVYEF